MKDMYSEEEFQVGISHLKSGPYCMESIGLYSYSMCSYTQLSWSGWIITDLLTVYIAIVT